MPPAKLNKWSGIATMLGGVLWTVLELLSNSAWNRTIFGLTYENYNRLKPLALVLLMVGLVSFFLRHQGRSGRLGRVGFGGAFLGLALFLVGNVVEFWIGGGIRFGDKAISTFGWTLVLLGVPLLGAGMILLGSATLRARVFSGWKRAIALLIGLVPGATILLALGIRSLLSAEEARLLVGHWGLAAYTVLFGLGWAFLGYALWCDKSTPQAGKPLTG